MYIYNKLPAVIVAKSHGKISLETVHTPIENSCEYLLIYQGLANDQVTGEKLDEK
jgi:hypothetical protein